MESIPMWRLKVTEQLRRRNLEQVVPFERVVQCCKCGGAVETAACSTRAPQAAE
jgi:hypothetical protein